MSEKFKPELEGKELKKRQELIDDITNMWQTGLFDREQKFEKAFEQLTGRKEEEVAYDREGMEKILRDLGAEELERLHAVANSVWLTDSDEAHKELLKKLEKGDRKSGVL